MEWKKLVEAVKRDDRVYYGSPAGQKYLVLLNGWLIPVFLLELERTDLNEVRLKIDLKVQLSAIKYVVTRDMIKIAEVR